MESIRIEHLTFTYPGQADAALRDVSFTVRQGDFFVLCGPSGCGKSTLLRQLKPALAPHGERSGSIFFEGAPLEALSDTAAAAAIGFVQQSPDAQLVTDKVWHELAFGMECLGLDTQTIRRRTAEMAAFFGMEGWFYQDVAALSGGQKQLLCLAAVMTMQPRLLILDEPTAQLDPIAASEFLTALQKINRELGVTVLLSEHRLEEALPMATAAALLDCGRLLHAGTPQQLGLWLREHRSGMFAAMPTAMRVWGSVDSAAPCPVTPVQGRLFLEEYAAGHPLHPLTRAPRPAADGPVRLQAKELWFRYEKDGPDVVKGLELTVRGGELLCILGGNGAGKTTALRLLAGLRRPYRGSITRDGRIALLPQDPQTLFVKKTVEEDLADAMRESSLSEAEKQAEIAEKAALCGIPHLLERHPYDLSGGEQQRAALAKLLLLHPDVLLLDEPTKGLDAPSKAALAKLLRQLCRGGAAVVLVSHDIEFSACHADRCALFFDGATVTEGAPEDFFARNSFYTTAAGRIARRVAPEAVTCADVITVIGGRAGSEDAAAFPLSEESSPAQWGAAPLTAENVLPPPEEAVLPPPDTVSPKAENGLSPQRGAVLPPEETNHLQKPATLPKGRRIAAAVTGAAALGMLIYILCNRSLRGLLSADGYTAAGGRRLLLYAAFAVLLLTLTVLLGRRDTLPVRQRSAQETKRLNARTRLAAVMILLLIPLTLYIGVVLLEKKQYYITALAVLLECMLPFFLLFEERKPRPRELVTVAALCALGVAGRAVFFMLPQFKPVIALVIVAGVAFGGETGFLVGAVTMLVSNILFSQGPWTPWQMFAMGIIGFLAGTLYRRGMLRRSRASLAVFGAVCAVVIYGGILNPGSALMWASETLNVRILLSYYLTGLPMDCVQAAATAIFLWFGAEPMLEKLERIKVKYGMTE